MPETVFLKLNDPLSYSKPKEIQEFPAEILAIIFSCLPLASLLNASLVSKQWWKVSKPIKIELCCKREGIIGRIKTKDDGEAVYKKYRESAPQSFLTFAIAYTVHFTVLTQNKGIISAFDREDNLLIWGHAAKDTGIADMHPAKKPFVKKEMENLAPSGIHDVLITLKAFFFCRKDGAILSVDRHSYEISTIRCPIGGKVHALELRDKKLIALFEDCSIAHWDAEKLDFLGAISEKKDDLSCYDIRGDRVATAGKVFHSSAVLIWDMQKNCVYSLPNIKADILTLRLYEDSAYIGSSQGEVFKWDFTKETIAKKVFEEKSCAVLFIHPQEKGLLVGLSNGKVRLFGYEAEFKPKPQVYFFIKNQENEILGAHYGEGKLNFNRITAKRFGLKQFSKHAFILELVSEAGHKIGSMASNEPIACLSFKKDAIGVVTHNGTVALWKNPSPFLTELFEKTVHLVANSPQFSFRFKNLS